MCHGGELYIKVDHSATVFDDVYDYGGSSQPPDVWDSSPRDFPEDDNPQDGADNTGGLMGVTVQTDESVAKIKSKKAKLVPKTKTQLKKDRLRLEKEFLLERESEVAPYVVVDSAAAKASRLYEKGMSMAQAVRKVKGEPPEVKVVGSGWDRYNRVQLFVDHPIEQRKLGSTQSPHVKRSVRGGARVRRGKRADWYRGNLPLPQVDDDRMPRFVEASVKRKKLERMVDKIRDSSKPDYNSERDQAKDQQVENEGGLHRRTRRKKIHEVRIHPVMKRRLDAAAMKYRVAMSLVREKNPLAALRRYKDSIELLRDVCKALIIMLINTTGKYQKMQQANWLLNFLHVNGASINPETPLVKLLGDFMINDYKEFGFERLDREVNAFIKQYGPDLDELRNYVRQQAFEIEDALMRSLGKRVGKRYYGMPSEIPKENVSRIHLSQMRVLLIIAGDVEQNPGPPTEDDEKFCEMYQKSDQFPPAVSHFHPMRGLLFSAYRGKYQMRGVKTDGSFSIVEVDLDFDLLHRILKSAANGFDKTITREDQDRAEKIFVERGLNMYKTLHANFGVEEIMQPEIEIPLEYSEPILVKREGPSNHTVTTTDPCDDMVTAASKYLEEDSTKPDLVKMFDEDNGKTKESKKKMSLARAITQENHAVRREVKKVVKKEAKENRGTHKRGEVTKALVDELQKAQGERDAMKEVVDMYESCLEDTVEKMENSKRYVKELESLLGQAKAHTVIDPPRDGFVIGDDDPVRYMVEFHGNYDPMSYKISDPNNLVVVHESGCFEVIGDGLAGYAFKVPASFYQVAARAACPDDPLQRYQNMLKALQAAELSKFDIQRDGVYYARHLSEIAFVLVGIVKPEGRRKWLNENPEFRPILYCVEPPLNWRERLKAAGFELMEDIYDLQASQYSKIRACPVRTQYVPEMPDYPMISTNVAGICKRLIPDLPFRTPEAEEGITRVVSDLLNYYDTTGLREHTPDREELFVKALEGRTLAEKKQMALGYEMYVDPQKRDEALEFYLNFPYKAFWKLETYLKLSRKPPRYIMSLPLILRGIQVAAMCRILWQVEQLTRMCNVKHLTAEEITELLKEKFRNWPTVAETDFSSFESCLQSALKNLIENRVFKYLADDYDLPFIRDALERETVKLYGPGFRCLNFTHIRMSGDYWTSLGNLLSNLVILTYATNSNIVDFMKVSLIEGDDAVFPCPEDIASVQKRAEDCGVLLKFDTAPWYALSFCGNKFRQLPDGSLVRYRDPFKTLTSVTVLFGADKSTRKNDMMLQRSKILSVLDGPWVPGASAFCAAYEFFSRGSPVDTELLLRMGFMKEYSGHGDESCVPRWLKSCKTCVTAAWEISKHDRAGGGFLTPLDVFRMLKQMPSGYVDLDLIDDTPGISEWIAHPGLSLTNKSFLAPGMLNRYDAEDFHLPNWRIYSGRNGIRNGIPMHHTLFCYYLPRVLFVMFVLLPILCLVVPPIIKYVFYLIAWFVGRLVSMFSVQHDASGAHGFTEIIVEILSWCVWVFAEAIKRAFFH